MDNVGAAQRGIEGRPRRWRGRGSGVWERRGRGGGMQWSVVTWRDASQSAAQPRGQS
jgi:hypothetical protein